MRVFYITQILLLGLVAAVPAPEDHQSHGRRLIVSSILCRQSLMCREVLT